MSPIRKSVSNCLPSSLLYLQCWIYSVLSCPVQIYLCSSWAIHVLVDKPGSQGLAMLPVQLSFGGQTELGEFSDSMALGIWFFLLRSNCLIYLRFFDENWQRDICIEQWGGYVQQCRNLSLVNQATKKKKKKEEKEVGKAFLFAGAYERFMSTDPPHKVFLAFLCFLSATQSYKPLCKMHKEQCLLRGECQNKS